MFRQGQESGDEGQVDEEMDACEPQRFGVRTGEPLDSGEVREGRGKEYETFMESLRTRSLSAPSSRQSSQEDLHGVSLRRSTCQRWEVCWATKKQPCTGHATHHNSGKENWRPL